MRRTLTHVFDSVNNFFRKLQNSFRRERHRQVPLNQQDKVYRTLILSSTLFYQSAKIFSVLITRSTLFEISFAPKNARGFFSPRYDSQSGRFCAKSFARAITMSISASEKRRSRKMIKEL